MDIPARPAAALNTRRFPRIARAIALIPAAAALLWTWNLAHYSSPVNVVDRAGQAIKTGDWRAVYRLVGWSDQQKQILSEDRFTTLASLYGNVYALEEYRLGSPRIDGDSALVPVTLTAKVSGLFGSSTRQETVDVKCVRESGNWRIAPDLHNGLLSLPGTGIAGL
jgi:hypothetical protein